MGFDAHTHVKTCSKRELVMKQSVSSFFLPERFLYMWSAIDELRICTVMFSVSRADLPDSYHLSSRTFSNL